MAFFEFSFSEIQTCIADWKNNVITMSQAGGLKGFRISGFGGDGFFCTMGAVRNWVCLGCLSPVVIPHMEPSS